MNFEEIRRGIGVSGVFTRAYSTAPGQARGLRSLWTARGMDRDLPEAE
jgi:hypothetical protein